MFEHQRTFIKQPLFYYCLTLKQVTPMVLCSIFKRSLKDAIATGQNLSFNLLS